jgi:DNA-nicking Smr family endonuclease
MSLKLRTVDLETGFPSRDEACLRLESELARARKDHVGVLKLIHGYGSTGSGGTLRFALRSLLRQK